MEKQIHLCKVVQGRKRYSMKTKQKRREKDGAEEDVVTDGAAGKTLNKAKRKSTERQRKREVEGGLNQNRLLNFTGSRFTKLSQSRAHVPSYCLTPLTRLWHLDHNVSWTQRSSVNLLRHHKGLKKTIAHQLVAAEQPLWEVNTPLTATGHLDNWC